MTIIAAETVLDNIIKHIKITIIVHRAYLLLDKGTITLAINLDSLLIFLGNNLRGMLIHSIFLISPAFAFKSPLSIIPLNSFT